MRDRDERRPVADGPWMWTVEAVDGCAMGRASSRMSALRWVHDVMARRTDARAVIVGPGLARPMRMTAEGGAIYTDVDW